jgi:hypothetical protein
LSPKSDEDLQGEHGLLDGASWNFPPSPFETATLHSFEHFSMFSFRLGLLSSAKIESDLGDEA